MFLCFTILDVSSKEKLLMLIITLLIRIESAPTESTSMLSEVLYSSYR